MILIQTWTPAERQAALDKAHEGKKLTDHEVRKLTEATSQAGRFGGAAKAALAEDEKRFGKR